MKLQVRQQIKHGKVEKNAIRYSGGTFVKDKNGNLVDVSQVLTQIIRMK